jgi:hypothetical protein
MLSIFFHVYFILIYINIIHLDCCTFRTPFALHHVLFCVTWCQCLAQSLVDSMNNACRICLEAADVGDYQAGGGRGLDNQVAVMLWCLSCLMPMMTSMSQYVPVKCKQYKGSRSGLCSIRLYHSMPLSDLVWCT